jgi:transcriptional regulator with XRE-family HTH domain
MAIGDPLHQVSVNHLEFNYDFGEMRFMARAGKALKRVLTRYGISQNQLATVMGIDRSNVSRWVSESRDPSAEAVAQIKQALMQLQAAAAEDFVQFYLYEGMDDPVKSPRSHPAQSSEPLHLPLRAEHPMEAALSAIAANRHPGFVM